MPTTDTLYAVANTVIEQSVLSALAYFSIFKHPLTTAEVWQYAAYHDLTQDAVEDILLRLADEGRVYTDGTYFQLENRPEYIAERTENARRADAFLPIARQKARFIARFPFVRAVMVSGSLSKHCMRPDSDIDFFVITTPGRLWLARTLLVLFKKIFLLNSHKYFCVNYFIDTEHLSIEEKNLFTATETVTLLPLHGREWYERFVQANKWARMQFYPHFPVHSSAEIPVLVPAFLQKSLEWLLGGRLGTWLDQAAMRGTVRFWQRKFHDFDAQKFDLALKSRRYISKHHPLHFQQKVLDAHAAKMKALTADISF